MAEKEFEFEDPFEMTAIELPVADPDAYDTEMARTFIEEFLLMGRSDEEIFSLFAEPFYQATYRVLQRKGELFVRNLIQEVRHG